MTVDLAQDLSEWPLAIRTRGLTKIYGRYRALNELSLQVPDGAVYLLVGPNGAGKSTTIRVLLDLIRPDAGTASVFGRSTERDSALIRANIGYVPEQLDWGHGWMKVGRLLAHHSRYFPTWDHQYANRLCHMFDLRMYQRMNTLSKGQRRRVHIAMALAHRPPLLLLDEPTDGLDPLMRDDVLGTFIAHVADSPTTVLISTHHVSEFEQLADYVGVMQGGALRAQLSMEELRRNLKRYRADVPEGWHGTSVFNGSAIRRTTTHRQIDWVVWGTESEVVGRLTMTGATVRDCSALTLNDATLALLGAREHVR
ncbi:MAG: ABC transporter ATP-binding protein [Gemmatimonadota bacterium]